jgi:hypothetical protein
VKYYKSQNKPVREIASHVYFIYAFHLNDSMPGVQTARHLKAAGYNFTDITRALAPYWVVSDDDSYNRDTDYYEGMGHYTGDNRYETLGCVLESVRGSWDNVSVPSALLSVKKNYGAPNEQEHLRMLDVVRWSADCGGLTAHKVWSVFTELYGSQVFNNYALIHSDTNPQFLYIWGVKEVGLSLQEAWQLVGNLPYNKISIVETLKKVGYDSKEVDRIVLEGIEDFFKLTSRIF